MNLYQEKLQDIHDFRDQYVAMKKVGDEQGLCFGRCKDDVKAVMIKRLVTPNSSTAKGGYG